MGSPCQSPRGSSTKPSREVSLELREGRCHTLQGTSWVEPRSRAHLWAYPGKDTQDLAFFSAIEDGLLELFPQYYTHGEEVILSEEMQVLLDSRNGCWGGKMPSIYRGLLVRDDLVESPVSVSLSSLSF